MAYLVRIMPSAERDLEAIFLYIRAKTAPLAAKWFNDLVSAIESLAEHPQRCPTAPEDPSLRHLLCGNKPHIYRIIDAINLPGQRVDILHVHHHAQAAFDPKSTKATS